MNRILIVHTSWYQEHISKMINISEEILEQKFECHKAKAPGAIELSALAKNKISIANLIQKPSVNRTANVMLITHSSKELNIQKVLKSLSKQNELFKKIVMIRVRDLKKL